MAVHKNNKIISNFYLIRENGRATYVGYTNRPVKQRFREHLKEKDFTGDDVTVEELDSLSFPFTWDINLINQYAQEVSKRETALIAEYGTATSVWQRGFNGLVGGQTWANVKNFVITNRDNPKFSGVEEADVVELIAYQKKVKHELYNVIGKTEPKETIRLKSVIGGTKSAEHLRLSRVIGGTKSAEHIRLQNVIGGTQSAEIRRLNHIIGHTIPKETQRLKSVISTTTPKEIQILKSIVDSTIPKETQRLQNAVRHTMSSATQRLQNIVRHTIPKETQRLQNIIQHTRV